MIYCFVTRDGFIVFFFINRKLNFGDGQMLKAQETKIPHGRMYQKFCNF